MRIETQEALSACCEKWQKILRLQDWDVLCVLVSHHEDLSEHALGDCMTCIELKKAHVRVLHPDATPKGWDGKICEDQERILVHELLHIHFSPFEPADRESLDYAMWEQSIDVLARVLVGLV